jgi:cytochrome c oxidase subunit 4
MSTITSSGHGHGEVAPPNEIVEEQIVHPPVITYFIIFGVLMGLLVLTVVVYSFDLNAKWHLNFMNISVAMFIAVIKAALVVLFFMNVRGGTKLIWLWAALGFIWLPLMAGVFMDYLTRPWMNVHGWQ